MCIYIYIYIYIYNTLHYIHTYMHIYINIHTFSILLHVGCKLKKNTTWKKVGLIVGLSWHSWVSSTRGCPDASSHPSSHVWTKSTQVFPYVFLYYHHVSYEVIIMFPCFSHMFPDHWVINKPGPWAPCNPPFLDKRNNKLNPRGPNLGVF